MVVNVTCFVLVTAAGISQFGVLAGLGIGAAVYLLTPWPVR